MSVDFALPQMGFDMTEAKIAHWTKREGEKIEAGEILAEVATEKVNLELVDHPGGVIEKILVPEGETVAVGTPIIRFGNANEGAAAPAPAAPDAAPPASTAKDVQQSNGNQPAASPSSLPDNAGEQRSDGAAPTISSSGAAGASGPAASDGNGSAAAHRVKVSPLARRLAEEKGINLGSVQGTGPMGRIVREDVLNYAEGKTSYPAAAAPAPLPQAPTPVTAGPATASGTTSSTPTLSTAGPQELSPMRQAIARRMQESKQQIPHFYLTTEVRMDAVFKLRGELAQAAGEELKISVNDFVIKASAIALARHPGINAWFVDGKIRIHERINIALAVALEEGLVVPALLDCQNRSLGQISTAAKDLAQRARKGAMKPEEFTGGTFTISNLGMYGVDVFQAIINPPQIAILSVGAARKASVVENGQLIVGTTMNVGISVDHRATDGAVAAKFLAEIKRLLENPMLMLL